MAKGGKGKKSGGSRLGGQFAKGGGRVPANPNHHPAGGGSTSGGGGSRSGGGGGPKRTARIERAKKSLGPKRGGGGGGGGGGDGDHHATIKRSGGGGGGPKSHESGTRVHSQRGEHNPTLNKSGKLERAREVLGRAGKLDSRGRVEPHDVPSSRAMGEVSLGKLGSVKQSQIHLKRPKQPAVSESRSAHAKARSSDISAADAKSAASKHRMRFQDSSDYGGLGAQTSHGRYAVRTDNMTGKSSLHYYSDRSGDEKKLASGSKKQLIRKALIHNVAMKSRKDTANRMFGY